MDASLSFLESIFMVVILGLSFKVYLNHRREKATRAIQEEILKRSVRDRVGHFTIPQLVKRANERYERYLRNRSGKE